jgi:hypothetical protein
MKFNTYREAVEFFTYWIAECEAQAAPLAGMAAMLLSQKKIEKNDARDFTCTYRSRIVKA